MKIKLTRILINISLLLTLSQCEKADKELSTTTINDTTSINNSNADLMQGHYAGNGQYLPGEIYLGADPVCTTFSYSGYLQIGTANLFVNKISNDTISLIYSSNTFPTINYGNTPITKNANIISFYGGTYNVITKYFSFSGKTPNSVYQQSNACLIQFPYVYGKDFFGSGNYTYQTIEHLEFTGTKN